MSENDQDICPVSLSSNVGRMEMRTQSCFTKLEWMAISLARKNKRSGWGASGLQLCYLLANSWGTEREEKTWTWGQSQPEQHRFETTYLSISLHSYSIPPLEATFRESCLCDPETFPKLTSSHIYLINGVGNRS